MAPHLSTQRAEEYRQRVIPEAELLAVDDHLAECEECRQRVFATVETEAVISDVHRRLVSDSSAMGSDHVSYEMLVALVDGEHVTDAEALQTHLRSCKSCVEEVNDLKKLRAELVALTTKETSRTAGPSFTEKIRALIHADRLSWRPALTAALALLFLAGAVALFFAWRASRRSQAPLQATHPAPQASQDSNTANVGPPPSPQQELTPDDNVVVTLIDGGVSVTVDVNGNIRGLAPLPAESSQAVKRALTTGRVEVPDMSELIGAKSRLLGPPNDGVAFSLISPVGVVTRNTKPTFRWQPLSGATSYTVAILDSAYNVVITSPSLTTASWTPTVHLARGSVYAWQVTAVKDGKETISPSPPASEARFKILEKAIVDELSDVEKLSGNSHLVRGTLYARAGLLQEAEKEIRALVAANPDSQRARQLLQSIRALTSQHKKPN